MDDDLEEFLAKQPTHAAMIEAARVIESTWVDAEPEVRRRLCEKYPSPVRPHQDLWMDSPPKETVVPDYPPCPRCQNSKLEFSRIAEEIRHSGDAIGRSYHTCKRCGWTCWWRFDDAS
jgi:hypothetical protein